MELWRRAMFAKWHLEFMKVVRGSIALRLLCEYTQHQEEDQDSFYFIFENIQERRQIVPTSRGSILHPPRASEVPYHVKHIFKAILWVCDFPYIFPIGS